MRHSLWRVAMASSTGTSHVAAAQPCQDAHYHVETAGPDGKPVMVLAVSDGAGTAAMAETGAALVCSTFARLIAAYVEQGGRVESIGRPLVERWIAGVNYRLELHAKDTGAALEDYACTLIAAAVAEQEAVFVQIGDGAIVLSASDGWKHVFWPQHGEFANSTNFITSAHRLSALEFERLGEPVEELALFTDGIENLVLRKAAKAVHAPFFESMFPAVRRSTASGVDAELSRALGGYLSSAPVNDRTDDNKTLVLASRR
ncbi:PP2C family serine/threonine-protein phosphatase [soil metagenome]